MRGDVGRSVMARKATPKSETPPAGGGYAPMMGGCTPAPITDVTTLPDYNPVKIFVGGVSHAVDEEQFKNYFSQVTPPQSRIDARRYDSNEP